MEDFDESGGSARLHTERHDVVDLDLECATGDQFVVAVALGDFDAHAFHTEHLADQRRECLHRAPELAAEDSTELLELLVGGLVVHHERELPIAVRHYLRGVCDRHNGAVADIDVIYRAAVDMEDQHGVAAFGVSAGVKGDSARARHVAGTVFGETSRTVCGGVGCSTMWFVT